MDVIVKAELLHQISGVRVLGGMADHALSYQLLRDSHRVTASGELVWREDILSQPFRYNKLFFKGSPPVY